MATAEQYENHLADYDASIVTHFTSYYDNTDFKNGYTLAGTMRGPFCIKMNRVHGVIGVYASGSGITTTYKVLVSSRCVNLATDYANKDAARPPAHQRITRISVLNNKNSNDCVVTHELSYRHMDTAGGFALNTIAKHEEWCLIESNDSIVLVFGDDRREGAGFFGLSNSDGAATCKFNVNYADTFMWFDEKSTSLPFRMQIELNDYMDAFYQERRDSLLNMKLNLEDVESAKSRFVDEWINSEFDEKGSMEEYFRRIDILAHTKICETTHSKLPEFCVIDRNLAVNKLRGTRLRNATDNENKVPVVVAKNGRELHDRIRLDDVRVGGLFLYQKPLASFKIDLEQKLVLFTPIGVSECYEIIQYIVY